MNYNSDKHEMNSAILTHGRNEEVSKYITQAKTKDVRNAI